MIKSEHYACGLKCYLLNGRWLRKVERASLWTLFSLLEFLILSVFMPATKNLLDNLTVKCSPLTPIWCQNWEASCDCSWNFPKTSNTTSTPIWQGLKTNLFLHFFILHTTTFCVHLPVLTDLTEKRLPNQSLDFHKTFIWITIFVSAYNFLTIFDDNDCTSTKCIGEKPGRV